MANLEPAGGAACLQAPAALAAPEHPAAFSADEVARGAKLATLGDCMGCHSAKGQPDYTGGKALHSPLGTIYSTNITPDPEAGIGRYTYQQFDDALRKGVAPEHRLYPAMPYTSYAKTTDADIHALYAYFMQGVKPVRHTPPETNLPFPFNQRWGLALWAWAFVEPTPYQTNASQTAEWNRGAYLVQGLGHCGACHTPRGVGYQQKGYDQSSASYLTGGITEHWLAPNLTSDPTSGLGRWSQKDIVAFLKTGKGGNSMVFGPMQEVVHDSLQHVDEAELTAMATYLKSLPAQAQAASFNPATASRPTQEWLAKGNVHVPGAGLYNNFCAKCHQANGQGEMDKAPALAASPLVQSADPSSVIHIILSGGKPLPGGEFKPMPSFADQFTDQEIADVATFVRRSWGNNAAPVTQRAVANIRASIKQ